MLDGIEHIFFDLDNTLWDFRGNSNETLLELYDDFELHTLGFEHASTFLDCYHRHNDDEWKAYREGRTDKHKLRVDRFRRTFSEYGHQDSTLAYEFSDAYLSRCPLKPGLLPNTFKVLDYLKPNYKMHIITNGFAEVQSVKMKHSGLDVFFDEVITSEQAGAVKPSIKIFEHAIEAAGAKTQNTVYIGDQPEIDGLASLQSGMHFIWFNPEQTPHHHPFKYEISDLEELMEIL